MEPDILDWFSYRDLKCQHIWWLSNLHWLQEDCYSSRNSRSFYAKNIFSMADIKIAAFFFLLFFFSFKCRLITLQLLHFVPCMSCGIYARLVWWMTDTSIVWLTNKILKWKKVQWRQTKVMCPWSSGSNAGYDWPHLLLYFRETAMTSDWINWWCKCFPQSSLKDCVCLPDQHGEDDMWLNPK